MSKPSENESYKTVAVVDATFERNHLGLKSRISEDLGGKPVLRCTVEKMLKAWYVNNVYVVVENDKDLECARALLEGLDVTVVVNEFGDIPGRPLLLRRRKWALDSWRGGIGSATYFDEFGVPAMLHKICMDFEADALLFASGAAALIDPDISFGVFKWHVDHSSYVRYTFSATPPGLSPQAFSPAVLNLLSNTHISPGMLLAYSPEKPEIDPLFRDAHYKVSQEIIKTPFRLAADTERSFELMREIVERLGPDPAALDIARLLRASPEITAGRVPREVEIEVTTRSRLQAAWSPGRLLERAEADMSLEHFSGIVDSLGVYDDVRLTLGGFGEPTMHPQLMDMIRIARDAGIFAIAIETDGLSIDKQYARSLVESGVDVVAVSLDALRPEVYAKLKGSDSLESAVAGTHTLISVRDSLGSDGPVVLTTMVKSLETDGEWVPFYDYWFRRSDAPIARTFNNYAGQVDDRTPIHLAPPGRVPCSKLFRSMLIMCDGTVSVCPQDFRGLSIAGNAFEMPIEQIWRGEVIEKLRAAHCKSDFSAFQLCEKCMDWYY